MEIKSRYEVIADLEKQKRDLIEERDNLDTTLKVKEREVKKAEQTKEDQIVAWDRKIEDLKEDKENFKEKIEDRRVTINELIKSVDESLKRFENIQSQK